MSIPRRRIVRLSPAPGTPAPQRHQQLERPRARLDHERTALARWRKRLRRAFTAVEKHQRNVSGLTRQIARQEE